jgi:hypothetical protein
VSKSFVRFGEAIKITGRGRKGRRKDKRDLRKSTVEASEEK